jgi:hypothetical protein
MIQTGVQSTGSRRSARRNRSLVRFIEEPGMGNGEKEDQEQ